MSQNNTFIGLVARIADTDQMLKSNAYAVINRSVTARAWLTGMYIVEYEQKGQDRAQYGENLLKNLSKRLGEKNYSISTLKDYRQFYLYYPQLLAPLGEYLVREFPVLLSSHPLLSKSQPVVGELRMSGAEEKSHPLVGFFKEDERRSVIWSPMTIPQ